MTNDTTCQPRDLEATDLTLEHSLLLTCYLGVKGCYDKKKLWRLGTFIWSLNRCSRGYEDIRM